MMFSLSWPILNLCFEWSCLLLSAEPNNFSSQRVCQNSFTATIVRSNRERRATILSLLSWHQSWAGKKEGQRRTSVKHRRQRNSEWGMISRTACREICPERMKSTMEKYRCLGKGHGRKLFKKGHRQVLQAERAGAYVSKWGSFSGRSRNPTKDCTTTQLQVKPAASTFITCFSQTKSMFHLFSVPSSHDRVPWLAQIVQVCTTNLYTDFFIEMIPSHRISCKIMISEALSKSVQV